MLDLPAALTHVQLPVGIIVFISPAVQDMLGYAPTELFNQPLASILHPDCHGNFEGHVQRIMEIQFKRPLQGPELLSAFIFRSRSGVAVPLDGVGQAWQRGRNVEFVMSFRARHATAQAPSAAQQGQSQTQMNGSSAQAGASMPQQMNAQQHMLQPEQQQHAAAAEGGSAVPHVMPPQQSGFQAQGQSSQAVLSTTAAMPPPHTAQVPHSTGMVAMMPSAGMYMGGMSGGVSAPLMGGQAMYSSQPIPMGANGHMLNSMAMPAQGHSMQQVWPGSAGMGTMQASHMVGGHQMPHGMTAGMQLQQGAVLQQGSMPASH